MKLISTVCPNCGASLQVDADKKKLTCNYCGNDILIDDEVKHVQYDNAEETGYNFEKGRQRAQAEAMQEARAQQTQEPKKRKTWLWVIGWICIFPLPLTILMVRSKKVKTPIKVIVIILAWLLYLMIGLAGMSSDGNESKNNIKSFTFSRESYEVVEGESTKSSSVKVALRDRKAFSPEDVVFESEDESIAVIRFEKDALTTTLYFVIDGIAPGETKIYARSKDGAVESEHITVVVKDDGIIDPESIILNTDKTELSLGETANFTVEASPRGATIKEIVWLSSDTSIVTVNSSGVVKAVGGGTATITAKVSDNVQASIDISVDGTKRMMSVKINRSRDDDVNIGEDWGYIDEIDGECPVYHKVISVGDVIKFHAKYTEADDNPDVGEATISYTVTEEDIKNGFAVTLELYVKENSGRNSGKKAHFIITYNFTIE